MGEQFIAIRAGTRRNEADIYRLYDDMRRAAPLWRSPWGDVYLSSFDLVDQVLVSRAVSHTIQPGLTHGGGKKAASPIAEWLMFTDGADHLRLRRAFQAPFAGSDGSLARRVTAIVGDRMSTVALGAPIDAVAQFTRAIPETLIGSMLGLPPSDLPLLRAWSQDIRTALDVGMETIAAGDALAATDLTNYFLDVLNRTRTVGDFAVGELVNVVGARAAAANLAFIAFAGYETTVHLLASMLLHLSERPDIWDRLKQSPDLAPVVVAETLRLESPVQKACRWALSDIDLPGGYKLRAGDYVVLLLGAANRDPARFAGPDRIDLSRTQNIHVGFGKGLHACLGRGLAMIEGATVLRWLVENVSSINAGGADPEWIENSSFRGLKRLPVTLRR